MDPRCQGYGFVLCQLLLDLSHVLDREYLEGSCSREMEIGDHTIPHLLQRIQRLPSFPLIESLVESLVESLNVISPVLFLWVQDTTFQQSTIRELGWDPSLYDMQGSPSLRCQVSSTFGVICDHRIQDQEGKSG